MLIRIDDSMLNAEDVDTLSDEVLLALEVLASARREGKHAVIAERETLRRISRCTHLSKFAREIYTKLYNHFTQFQSYHSAVTRYIEVVNPCLVPQIVTTFDKQVIRVPPGFFKDSELAQKSILLCEHLNDSNFYKFLAKVCLKWKNNNVYLACEHRGGGGNTISTEYTNIQTSSKHLCLCIVDSDRLAPGGPLGSTASRVQSQSDSDCIITQLYILGLRELENLLPNSILAELCSGSRERENALAIFEQIQSSSVTETKFFLDIKKGSLMKEIVISSNPNIKNFWITKISNISSISRSVDPWCEKHWQCSQPSNCQCRFSLGFGDSILESAIDYFNVKSVHEISRLVDNSTRSEWEKIGQVVIDWCFAGSPMRA